MIPGGDSVRSLLILSSSWRVVEDWEDSAGARITTSGAVPGVAGIDVLGIVAPAAASGILRAAEKIVGAGEAIATPNGGGGAKPDTDIPSSDPCRGGVSGGTSAYVNSLACG